MADKIADKGMESVFSGTTAISKALKKRHKDYTVLVARIQKMIVAIFKAERKLYEERKRTANPFGARKSRG